jgi:hypothetical protein
MLKHSFENLRVQKGLAFDGVNLKVEVSNFSHSGKYHPSPTSVTTGRSYEGGVSSVDSSTHGDMDFLSCSSSGAVSECGDSYSINNDEEEKSHDTVIGIAQVKPWRPSSPTDFLIPRTPQQIMRTKYQQRFYEESDLKKL